MGGNVKTFLSKFIIVWVDLTFGQENAEDSEDREFYKEIMGYVNELNSYNFCKCKTFTDSKKAVKLLDGRACPPAILISSGAFCKFKDEWGNGKTLLERINEKDKAVKRIIDHMIFCGDEDEYIPLQAENDLSKLKIVCTEEDEFDENILKILKKRQADLEKQKAETAAAEAKQEAEDMSLLDDADDLKQKKEAEEEAA